MTVTGQWRVVFDVNLPGWLPATSPFGTDRELGTSYSLHASAQYTLSEEDLTFDWPILGYCMPWLSRFRYARAMSEINLERVANKYDNSPLASYVFNSSPSPDSLLDPAFKLQVLASLPDYIDISDEQIPLVLRVRTKDVEAEAYKDVQILSLRTDFLQLESAGYDCYILSTKMPYSFHWTSVRKYRNFTRRCYLRSLASHPIYPSNALTPSPHYMIWA